MVLEITKTFARGIHNETQLTETRYSISETINISNRNKSSIALISTNKGLLRQILIKCKDNLNLIEIQGKNFRYHSINQWS